MSPPAEARTAPAAPHTVLLARYGELSLKTRGVRARFEQRLVANLERGLASAGVEGVVHRVPGRLYVHAPDLAAVGGILGRTFGITSWSPAAEVPADLAGILRAAADYVEVHAPSSARSFAIRARRQGSHPFSSQDVAIAAGQAVANRLRAVGREARVDLDAPDFELFIEVRLKRAHLFHQRGKAPGGLPLGTQGRLVAILDDAPSTVAAYLLMRRGADVHPVAFEEDRAGAEAAYATLLAWNVQPYLKWWRTEEPLPSDPVARARARLAGACSFAHRMKAQGVVTGETAATAWVPRLAELEGASDLPVYRPVLGLSRRIVEEYLGRIRRGES